MEKKKRTLRVNKNKPNEIHQMQQEYSKLIISVYQLLTCAFGENRNFTFPIQALSPILTQVPQHQLHDIIVREAGGILCLSSDMST